MVWYSCSRDIDSVYLVIKQFYYRENRSIYGVKRKFEHYLPVRIILTSYLFPINLLSSYCTQPIINYYCVTALALWTNIYQLTAKGQLYQLFRSSAGYFRPARLDWSISLLRNRHSLSLAQFVSSRLWVRTVTVYRLIYFNSIFQF